MAFQFESLVGHLFIVNGRTLSVPSPGALVEVAPKKASRGREADTVFILVMPSGDVASASFYEQLAELAAERFFNSSGSVTAGLRAVYDEINRNLIDHNRGGGRHYEANMLCAVLHDQNLILSRCGLGVAILKNGDDTILFPTDPLDENDVVFGPPLGVQPIPDVKMKQVPIQVGARLMLADAELIDLGIDRVRATLGKADIAAALLALQDIALARATVLAAEFVEPESSDDLFMPEGDNSRVILSQPIPDEKQPEKVSIEPDLGTRIVDSATALRDRTQDGLAKASAGVAKSAEVTSGLLDHYFSDDKPGWWSGPLGVTTAIGIPLVVVGLVIAFWVAGIDRSTFETCVVDALRVANIARDIDSSDVNGMLAGWNAVLLKVDECEDMRPEGIPETTLSDLRREGQTVIDRLLNIDRREAIPIASFPAAQLSQVVVRGLTMYVLDDANDIVYSVDLAADGRSAEPNTQAPIAEMRRNASVNQFTVGDLIDIAWAEDGTALSQSNVLVAVDRNGVVVEHSPTILTRGAQRLLGSENWIEPVAIQVWRGNLYILDPGANQIWRYSPSGGSYSAAPTEYFAGQQRPNIANAVDFAIDTNGAIYVMFGNGQMGKYITGEPQTFAFANFPPGQELGSANGMYLSDSPISQSIYIASEANRTVYEVTQAGTFMRSYRTFDEERFETLRAVIAEAGQQVIYALSGNTVFVINREG